ncbi:MAG: hypothetical protein M3209_10010 [Acidobacteriota bacterium]|nr:hypothetical protein [Acidobacteriota bacterium]
MNREEFVEMLETLSDSWQKRDYNRAASFFAENVRYADPLNYSFQTRADLQNSSKRMKAMNKKTSGITSFLMKRRKSAQSNTLMKAHVVITALRW